LVIAYAVVIENAILVTPEEMLMIRPSSRSRVRP
jgi:hypothetical protein